MNHRLDYGRPVRMLDVPGFRVCEIVYNSASVVPKQPHTWATLCLTIDGGYGVDWGRSRLTCGPASLMFQPPRQVYGVYISDAGSHCLSVDIDPPVLVAAADTWFDFERLNAARRMPPHWLAFQLRQELAFSDDLSFESVAGIVLALLAELGDRPDDAPSGCVSDKERIIMMQKSNTTVDSLWDAAARRFPVLSPEEQRAGIGLLRELARGEPVAIPQLAQALGISAGAAEALVRESTLSPFIHTDNEGRIVGFYGLAVAPTHHQLMVSGRTLWAWCAPDTLFLPELLGDTAEIESRDPETDHLIHLAGSPDRVDAADPKSIVVSVMRPDAWELTSADRIMASACHFMFFFASRASGERWVAEHPETVLVSLEDAFVFGKRLNAHMYGTELARRGAEET